MSSWLSDAEWAEEVRAAAVCGGGPNSKLYQAEIGAEQADSLRKRRKENPEAKTEREETTSGTPAPASPLPSRSVFACDDPEGDWIEDQKRG